MFPARHGQDLHCNYYEQTVTITRVPSSLPKLHRLFNTAILIRKLVMLDLCFEAEFILHQHEIHMTTFSTNAKYKI